MIERMSMAEHCLARADEAERLAAVVSYARDKIRLREQAKSLREEAQALSVAPTDVDAPAARGLGWFRRRSA